MDISTIAAVTEELVKHLPGGIFSRVFQLSKLSFAVDLQLDDSLYLYINAEASQPRAYLIKRRQRELERSSGTPGQFALLILRRLSGSVVSYVEQIQNERIIRLGFTGAGELTRDRIYDLVIQLTGRSANIFLLDETGLIIDHVRENHGVGQEIGTRFSPPERLDRSDKENSVEQMTGSISAKLDEFYLRQNAEREFTSLARSAEAKIHGELTKRKKLIRNLEQDLARHGHAEKWKRFGDLLLANIQTAKRSEGIVTVVDYFDESLANVSIEADDNESITETAERYFKRYTKSRNAAFEIEARLKKVDKEITRLETKELELKAAIDSHNIELLADLIGKKNPTDERKNTKKKPENPRGYRDFISSDGFEILVGKKAKDNDLLTFRVARSLDTWMHAADYPGSHVVIRNPNRSEIPQRTLIEAAKLAAFYSQGKTQTKAAVHYTQKKFVNKPKGAAPGLVSLASFKTLLVEPDFPDLPEKH